jgi:V-type H+-transporting ATPase subunit a
MFGDIYHGVCLTIFALFLCHYKRDLEHGKLKPLVQARYMLVMMGLFSIYAGVIYNDFAGLTVNFFGTCWEWHSEKSEWYPICTYPFGIDPVWMDQLSFMNSVKMKLSVIIAYLHMTLGILIMAFNQRAEGKKIGITSKFLPQLLFFTSTFGYMDLLIISKWTTSWSIPAQAPSIINTMIAMFLGLGTVDGPAMFAY